MATSSSERCCKQPNTGSRLTRPDALRFESLRVRRRLLVDIRASCARPIEAGDVLRPSARVADVSHEEFARAHRGARVTPLVSSFYWDLSIVLYWDEHLDLRPATASHSCIRRSEPLHEKDRISCKSFERRAKAKPVGSPASLRLWFSWVSAGILRVFAR